MELTNNQKKQGFIWLVVFAGAYFVCKFTFPKNKKSNKASATQIAEQDPSEREYINPPVVEESQIGLNPLSDNAFTGLKAYIAAYNAKEPQSVLDDLNKEIANDYGLKVIRRSSDKKLVVYDLNDKEVLVYSN